MCKNTIDIYLHDKLIDQIIIADIKSDELLATLIEKYKELNLVVENNKWTFKSC